MQEEQKPGTFRAIPPEELDEEYKRIVANILPGKPCVKVALKLEQTPRSIENYRFFASQFGTPGSIIYPCCFVDASPSQGFPNSRVLYIDNKLDVKDELTKLYSEKSLEFVCADAKTFQPQNDHDLLLILNPTLHTRSLSHLVKPGKLILANNYHRNANQMFEEPDSFEFLGLIDDRQRGNPVIVGIDEARAIYRKFTDFLSVFKKLQ